MRPACPAASPKVADTVSAEEQQVLQRMKQYLHSAPTAPAELQTIIRKFYKALFQSSTKQNVEEVSIVYKL